MLILRVSNSKCYTRYSTNIMRQFFRIPPSLNTKPLYSFLEMATFTFGGRLVFFAGKLHVWTRRLRLVQLFRPGPAPSLRSDI